MILIIKNQTAGTLSYLGGLVSISGNSNVTVPANYIFPISRDPGLINDATIVNVLLNDGDVDYASASAVAYLNQIATSIAGAVVGLVGSTAPGYAILVGSKDNNGNTQAASIDANGNIKVAADVHSSTSAVTSVASSASNVMLLATNVSRKGAIFYNNSTQICYLILGVSASNSNFTIAMAPNSTFIIDSNPIYTGEVDGIWVSANGAMLVTELT